jgi:hypothetical protein
MARLAIAASVLALVLAPALIAGEPREACRDRRCPKASRCRGAAV